MITGKTINELPEITNITTDAAFVVEISGTTYQIKTPNISTGNVYASYYSEVTQGVTGTLDDAYAMSAETTAYSVGFDVIDNSKFMAQSAGTYNVQFSSQISRVSGSSATVISIWLRVNGEDIEASRGDIYAGLNVIDSRQIAGWNFIQDLGAGDYFELVWATSNNLIIFESFPSETEPLPIKPSSPSIAISITQI